MSTQKCMFPQTIIESEWGESFYIDESNWDAYVSNIYKASGEDEDFETFEAEMPYTEWQLIVAHDDRAIYKTHTDYAIFAPNEGEYSMMEWGNFDELIENFPITVVAEALRKQIKTDPDGEVKTMLLSLTDHDTLALWRWFLEPRWWFDQRYFLRKLQQELLQLSQ